MFSGSQLQVAKLAQMCSAVPSSVQRRSAVQSGRQLKQSKPNPGRLVASNVANQCFFRAYHPFYILLKKGENGSVSQSESDRNLEAPKEPLGA